MSAGIIAAVVIAVILVAAFLWICLKNPDKNRLQTIENCTGFVRAYGRNLYDGQGRILKLVGVNLGNWFVQEFWMAVSAIGNFDTGIYTQTRGLAAMKANPNLSDNDISKLEKLYIDSYITADDFKIISSLGLNCVRVNFTYLTLTDGDKLKKDAFEKLDWVIDQCAKNGLYVILDLHGARGSQNMDIHSGSDADFDLFPNAENRAHTIWLWREIAKRYRSNTTVAAYDLLNEPRRAPYKFSGKTQFDFYDELYRAVREEDKNHLIMMECFTFPTHGVSPKKYGWLNVAYSYHIYNLAPVTQKMCLYFYRALTNLKGYNVPIIVGEWNAWNKFGDWQKSMDFFDRSGWSYISWTYKTNKYLYKKRKDRTAYCWGVFELDMPPVDLSSATYDEIASVWGAVSTADASKSLVYDVYMSRFGGKDGDK